MTPSKPFELITEGPVDDAVALDVITTNYRMCVNDRAKLESLQKWSKPVQ